MRKETQKRLDDLLKKMEALCTPLDPKHKAKRLARAAADDAYFFQTYLPNIFDQPPAAFHQELCALADRRQGKEVIVIAAPRGFGKTPVLSQGKPIKDICFARRKLILGVSATDDMAEDLTAPIAQELLENLRIRQDFGELVKRGSSTRFETTHGVSFRAVGRRVSIRGLHPDLCFLDDVEDDKQAANAERVKELLDWLWEVIYPAMKPASAGGSTLLVAGTILTRKSLLMQLLQNDGIPPEARRLYKALSLNDQGEYVSLWGARHPVWELLKTKQRIGTRRFEKEYQNTPQDDAAVFQESWFLPFTDMEFLEQQQAAAA